MLYAQVIDQQHLHINEPAGTVCEVCAHSDNHEAVSFNPHLVGANAAESVRYEAAVSATLAIKRWSRHSRAPPSLLT